MNKDCVSVVRTLTLMYEHIEKQLKTTNELLAELKRTMENDTAFTE